MIRLPNPKIRSLLETMPVKCLVEADPEMPHVTAVGEQYFYKAVTPAVFSVMKGRVAYVEVSEWLRAKRAMRRRRSKKPAAEKWSTNWERTMLGLRNGDSSFVKTYFVLGHAAGTESLSCVVSLSETETMHRSNVLLVPPTTTNRDVQVLVEPLVAAPQFETMRKSMTRIVMRERELENHRSRLDMRTTAHLALLIAQALKKPVRGLRALDDHQSLPAPLTAPTAQNTRPGETPTPRTILSTLFKIVPAHNLHRLRRGEIKYVLTGEWTGRSCSSVQMYTRASAGVRRKFGYPPGTVDSAGEGLVRRDQILLVPPRTTPPMMRRIIQNSLASEPELRIYIRTLSRVEREIRDGWLKASSIMRSERLLQMRLLREAFTPQRRPA